MTTLLPEIGARPESRAVTTIGQYLIDRLYELGVRHVFGIPGDYVLSFFKLLEKGPLRLVGTATEIGAGYAADAYARVNGLGTACVTYCVGGLNLANAVACAYAEKSPVVIISGAPGLQERKPNLFLHHTVQGYTTQLEVFRRLTVANGVLEDPMTAFREIDRILADCLRYKRPVYIELPRDRVNTASPREHQPLDEKPQSDPEALAEAVAETMAILRRSKKPIIIAGIEVHRFGLQDLVLQMAESNRIPVAALLLSKSVVRENHPLYVGIFGGGMGRPEVIDFVADSDCVLMLGAILNDLDSSNFTEKLDASHTIFATTEQVRIRFHNFQGILLEDFVRALCQVDLTHEPRPLPSSTSPLAASWKPEGETPVTSRRLFQKINAILDDQMAVVADPGDALFGATDLTSRQQTEFVGPSFYTTMGFAVPGAIGVQCANPRLRPMVLVGDGAFQMTGMELTTVVRQGLNPIVVLMNNKGYGTERFILDGSFNDILNWQYHRMPDLLGAGRGFEVWNEVELEKAMNEALAYRESYSLLNVHLEKNDISPALQRLAKRIAKRV